MIDEMLDNPNCFADHMGFYCIEPYWLTQAVAAIKAGTWSVRDVRAMAAVTAIGAMPDKPAKPYRATGDGIAIIPVDGPMMKGWSKFGGTSTVWARKAIRAAAADGEIAGIQMVMDSPGGHVAGTAELANDVARAARTKPVRAHIDDLCASAAFWVACQASVVTANATAEIGSIGTVAVVEDTSEQAKREGVRVIVCSTGPYKGAFANGAPVTDAHIEYLQARVDKLNEHFLSAVERGRKMSRKDVVKIADGRVHIAEDARALGLIDSVCSCDDAIAAFSADLAASRITRLRAQEHTAAADASAALDIEKSR